MPLAYSQDLRERVLKACARGMKTKQVADLFDVSPAWVRRVKQRLRENGEVAARAPIPKCRYRKIDRTRLQQLVQEHPDATLAELRQMLGVSCAESSIWKALSAMGYSFKKRRFMPQNKIGRT
jgi:transposase